MDAFVVLNSHVNTKGEMVTESREREGKVLIKQYSGINSDNFIVRKHDSDTQIKFSFFKLNGIRYVNINGEHILDYKRFTNIQQVSNLPEGGGIKVRNSHFGDIIIRDCDVEIFEKAVKVMAEHTAQSSGYVSDLLYYMFT